ncbi:MAG: PASTA domain-containing protein [Chitinophagaceae bacterium]|nr:PASTA domain-containing protein [Chitinophagaceae bacterium]MBP6045938.1 PASTA domain-containing protein [Ferruginibacter sp.]MBK7346264.1 PASTA domain-containing protein [Chitinophagaceae bacterium]MBK8774338.1 PASTA domain-containing protein [Chitinophagaceae bacterium]MBL0255538.1 PASTA domain-containing protein [Chitinophagaceae bacterium]
MFKFITNRPFWVNLLVALFLGALIIFGFLQTLSLITKHGEYLTVPKVTHLKTSEAIKLLESKGFAVEIQDSIYTDTAKMGVVIKQLPDANSTVKVNRTVLLIVNRVTMPLVEMPDLQGKSLNYAMEILNRSHLTLGDTSFRPDFMLGSVLEQHFKGSIIQPGAKIKWGSKIDLVIGGGLQDLRIPVPDVTGMMYGDAKLILQDHGINIGALIVETGIRDTFAAFIIKQNPSHLSELDKKIMYMQSGQVIDIWLSKENKAFTDSTANNKN